VRFLFGLRNFQESVMRSLLFAASTLAVLAVPGAASAQYYYDAADVYAPPPAAYVAPPVVAPAAPMVQSQVYLGQSYLAPGATYVPTPGVAYDDQAVIMNGQRYYRDCWWDWGRRRCEFKPWW